MRALQIHQAFRAINAFLFASSLHTYDLNFVQSILSACIKESLEQPITTNLSLIVEFLQVALSTKDPRVIDRCLSLLKCCLH